MSSESAPSEPQQGAKPAAASAEMSAATSAGVPGPLEWLEQQRTTGKISDGDHASSRWWLLTLGTEGPVVPDAAATSAPDPVDNGVASQDAPRVSPRVTRLFAPPTKEEIHSALRECLGGDERVTAYVIGRVAGGRNAIVATENATYVVTLALMKLKPGSQLARYPHGTVKAKRHLLSVKVGKHSVRIGMADSGRAAELEQAVNANSASP